MLLNCTYIAHALQRWLLTYQCKKKNKIKKEIVASTYVMISRNVHIYAWLKEAYVSAEVIDCVCTVSAT